MRAREPGCQHRERIAVNTASGVAGEDRKTSPLSPKDAIASRIASRTKIASIKGGSPTALLPWIVLSCAEGDVEFGGHVADSGDLVRVGRLGEKDAVGCVQYMRAKFAAHAPRPPDATVPYPPYWRELTPHIAGDAMGTLPAISNLSRFIALIARSSYGTTDSGVLPSEVNVSVIAERPAVNTMTVPLNAASRYILVIRRFLLRVSAIATFFVAFPAIAAGPDIAAIQSKLKDMGLYYAKSDGSWGDETSAAVTRYQIRQGLEINGRLTGETLQSLGMGEDGAPPPDEQPRGDAWRILREEDTTVNEDLPPDSESGMAREEPAEGHTIVSVPSPVAKPSPILQDTKHVRQAEATPPTASETPSPAAAMPSPAGEAPARAVTVPPRAVAVPPRAVAVTQPQQSVRAVTQDRLRDYIAAYVLAGLAPSVEPELEFFADRVNYFGDSGVSKEVIRRDLEQYNAQYPQRHFWLAGDPQIQSETDEAIRVNFPLRFEVSGASGSKSGKLLKTVELRKTGRSLEIIAVDETRMN